MAPYLIGSMTSGGLSSLLIVTALLGEQAQLEERMARGLDCGIWGAIAWLATHYRVDADPGALHLGGLPAEQAKLLGKPPPPELDAAHLGYYLHGLERAMKIAGRRHLGTHDWDLEGARVLLDRQAPDGRWPKPRAAARPGVPPAQPAGAVMPLVDTCFALLFLQRATLRPRSPRIEVQAAQGR